MDATTLPNVMRKLDEACEVLEKVFSESHSFKFLVRSAASGVDYLGYWRKLTAVQATVHELGSLLYPGDDLHLSRGAHLERLYWCYVYIASSVLAEWAARSDREFREGERYKDRDKQAAVRRYLNAIKEAKRLRKQLPQRGDGP